MTQVPGTSGEFERLALDHMSPLYSMAVRLTRRPAEAEDLVQETLLRAYRFYDKYEQGTNFKAWLFRIMKNAFINRYRKSSREPETVEFSAIEDGLERIVDASFRGTRDAGTDPERIFMDGVVDGEIAEVLATLPDEYRMVFLMAVVEEMSYKEIATVLSCPIGTVMSRLHRARRLMQAGLLEFAARRGLVPPTAGGKGADVVDIRKFRSDTR